MLKKTKRLKGSYLLVTSILFLNFLGVSYAHWDQGLNINTKITTAEFLPSFLNGRVEGSNKGLKVDVKDERIEIYGRVDHDYSWRTVSYMVQNKSDIPIKLIFPDGKSQKLERNGNTKLDLQLRSNLNYEIICEQATD